MQIVFEVIFYSLSAAMPATRSPAFGDAEARRGKQRLPDLPVSNDNDFQLYFLSLFTNSAIRHVSLISLASI